MKLSFPHSRLFWKIFACIWLAQLTAILAVSAIFWLARQHDEARWAHSQSGETTQRSAWRPTPPGIQALRPLPGRDRSPIPWPPLITALFASLIFAALLAWYLSKPIRHLRQAFDAAASGRLETRIGTAMGNRRDELADLGRDFDRMASQLGTLMESQRRLLHDVSHELRSPLARLQMAIGLLRQPGQGEHTGQQDMLERIERESARMDHLVGELLTLSRLEANAAKFDPEPIELGPLLEDVVADARFEAAAQQRPIEVSLSGRCFVSGNAELLHRACENIIRNALLHTGGSAPIRLEMLPTEHREVRIAVLDRGPGLPEDRLTRIFEPFARHTESAPPVRGHGLGLAISARVVAMHEGRIRASNRNGGGLCVEIYLPCTTPAI